MRPKKGETMKIDDTTIIPLGVFPVSVKFDKKKDKYTKTPAVKSWQSHQSTHDELNNAKHIGITIPDNVVVFDLDIREALSLEDLQDNIEIALNCEMEIDWPLAFIQNTISGGAHYAFSLPEDVDIVQRTNVLKVKGFDLRVAGKGWICTGEDYDNTGNGYDNTIDAIHDNKRIRLPSVAIDKLSDQKIIGDDSDDDFMKLVEDNTLGLNNDEITDYMERLPKSYADDQDTWFRVGMALYHETNGNEFGWSLFDVFSAKCPEKYDEHANRSRWESFGGDKSSKLTFASIIKWVKDADKDVIKKTLVNDEHRQRAKIAMERAKKLVAEKVFFDIEVDLDICHMIITSCFWSPAQSRMRIINDINNPITLNEKDVNQMMVDFFGNPITNYDQLLNALEDEDLKLTQTVKNAMGSAVINNLIKMIKAYYQRNTLEQRVDMFSDRTYFDFKADKAVENNKHLKLVPAKGVFEDAGAVADYKAHFPMVEDVLRMIIAARFASSRKKAYIWLKAPSDWGKDFFRVALGEIATEMSVKEVEKAIEGAPVGKSPNDMLRSMVLVTNEFKHVKSELKQLEDCIKLSPKYQLETYIPLYTKLFMSAEGVDSLMGEHGIESQFANRFSLIDVDGNINSLDAFKRLGGHKMMQAVQTWFSQFMNDEIDSYISIGKDASARKGDETVVKFHEKYGIANGKKTIDDNLAAITDIIKEKLISKYQHAEDTHVDGQMMYLKSVKTRIKGIIFDSEVFDRSEAYTISYKIDGITKLLCSDKSGIKAHRFGGKVVKCLRIEMKNPFENDEIDEKDDF